MMCSSSCGPIKQPGELIRYSTNNLLSVTDLMGKIIESKPAGSTEAQIEIDEDAGPVYLLWKRPPAATVKER